MKDSLISLKSTNNKSIHDRIWWTYNYGADEDNQITNEIAEKLNGSLDSFIDELYSNYESITEKNLHNLMKCQVKKLCQIHYLISDEGLYDYGGLNDFFVDIAETFPFYQRAKYRNDTDMLFDCLNGNPISE